MVISPWGLTSFYLWLAEAAVILITTAYRSAHTNRPALCLLVAPLLVLCPGAGLALSLRLGLSPAVAVLGGLALTWLPLLGIALVPARRVPSTAQRTRPNVSARTAEHRATAPPRADDPYTILGVARGASREEITAAWRRRATESHPDTVAHLGPEARQAAHARMVQINQAYETLRRATHEPWLVGDHDSSSSDDGLHGA